MIATVMDFGIGNLHSLARALSDLNLRLRITEDARNALDSELLVLPGVGAFDEAALQLAAVRNELRVALAAGLPCLGICLGMQLLFEASEEGRVQGLGLIDGRVTRLAGRRLPHIGWNTVSGTDPCLDGQSPMYFAHSFACRPEDSSSVTAWAGEGEERFPAIVRSAATTGVQFHPEKSGPAGKRFLRQWLGTLWQ